MSWQNYVDDQLLKGGKIKKAAILGQKGGVWAVSQGYKLSEVEQSKAINAFSDPNDTQANGIRLGGQKYFTLSANANSVYGKKGADGCVLVKTTQAVLVAEFEAPIQQPEAVLVVEKLGDYLKSVGF